MLSCVIGHGLQNPVKNGKFSAVNCASYNKMLLGGTYIENKWQEAISNHLEIE